MNFWKTIQVGSFILGWLSRASQDGKITIDEIAALIQGAIDIADIDVTIELPTPGTDTHA